MLHYMSCLSCHGDAFLRLGITFYCPNSNLIMTVRLYPKHKNSHHHPLNILNTLKRAENIYYYDLPYRVIT